MNFNLKNLLLNHKFQSLEPCQRGHWFYIELKWEICIKNYVLLKYFWNYDLDQVSTLGSLSLLVFFFFNKQIIYDNTLSVRFPFFLEYISQTTYLFLWDTPTVFSVTILHTCISYSAVKKKANLFKRRTLF